MSGFNFVRVTPEFYGAIGDRALPTLRRIYQWLACPSTVIYFRK